MIRIRSQQHSSCLIWSAIIYSMAANVCDGCEFICDVFGESFISAKVAKFVEEIKQLSIITESQPHAAYSALTNGLIGRWTFLMQVVPSISEMLQPLEDAIRLHLLPAITGHATLSDMQKGECLHFQCEMVG